MSPLRRARSHPRSRLRVVAVGALVLVLAACGSNLDPDEVAQAGGNGAGTGGTGAAAGTDGSGVVVDGTGGTGATGTDGTGAGGTTGGTGGSGTDGTGGSGTGGTDGSGSGGTGGTDGSGTGGGDAAGDPPIKAPTAAQCKGLKNQTGITDTTITIGNSSDITGPAPGLFATAQDATAAFTNYFNAAVPGGICGRKLVLKTYDSQTNAGADQQAYAAACKEVFAMVGSNSAFDSGGAKTAQDCGLPDLRAGAITQVRNDCTTCFGVQAVNTSFFEKAVPQFVVKTVGADSAKRAAFFYTDQGAAAENAQAQVRAMKKEGMDFPIVQGISVSEFNYSSYVSALKSKKIDVVFYTTEYSFSIKLRQAMQQQGYTPKLYLRDPTDYNPKFVNQGGSAVDNTVVYTNFVPFEEKNAESDLYEDWLRRTKPGTDPLFFGVFAWSAARLFVTLSAQLGGKLTRESLIAETRKVNDWTANGLHAPQPVGNKGTGQCWRFIKLSGGRWSAVDGTKYKCSGLTKTN